MPHTTPTKISKGPCKIILSKLDEESRVIPRRIIKALMDKTSSILAAAITSVAMPWSFPYPRS
jgi:hypothetical protein